MALTYRIIIVICLLGCLASAVPSTVIFADEVDLLRNKIDEAQDQIDTIDEEIARYEAELNKVGTEKSTLQSAIDQLNLTRKKLLADITRTQKEIERTTYAIVAG